MIKVKKKRMKFNKTISVLIFLSTYFPSLQAQVNTESMRNANLTDTLMHVIDLDIGLEKSNEEVFDGSLKYRLDYSPNDNYSAFIVLNYENGYERLLNSSKNIITNKGFGHFRLTRKLNNTFFLEGFFQAGFNDFLLMKSRSLYGGGMRNNFFNKENAKIFLGLGVMQEIENYNLESNDKKNLLRSTNYLSSNIVINDKTNWKNTIYFQVASSDQRDYRLLYETGFEFSLSESINFSFEFNFRYDNQPHGDLGKTYYNIKNGISFSF